MRNSIKHRFWFPITAVVALIAAASPVRADDKTVTIIPPDATYHGKTYPEWTAAFWQFAAEQGCWAAGLRACDGHPSGSMGCDLPFLTRWGSAAGPAR